MKLSTIIDAPAVTVRAIHERRHRATADEDYAEQQAIDRGHCRAGKRVKPACELTMERGI